MWLAGSVRVRWIRKKYLNEARRGTEQSRSVFFKLQNLNSLSVWDTKEGWIWISSHSTFTLINYTASRLNTTRESLAHVSSEWFELGFLPATHSTNLCQSNRFAIGALQRGWHLFATLLMMPILPTAGLNRLNFAHQQTSDFCVLSFLCVFRCVLGCYDFLPSSCRSGWRLGVDLKRLLYHTLPSSCYCPKCRKWRWKLCYLI